MISILGLTKLYKDGAIPAVDNISLEIAENSIFGFLGPNGAGKTTTIKILTGLMSPTSGSVKIAGEVMTINSVALKNKIGYLGQEPKMYSWMKGKELLLFVGKIFGLSKTENLKRANELLDMSGLSQSANKKISSYSGGMTQRLGIAQAMMGNPKILFLDEPTSALDPIGRKEVLDFILKLKKTSTVFLSTHILSDVERVCDTVAIIDKGKIITHDKIDDLKKKFSQKIIEIEVSNSDDIEFLQKNLKNSNTGEIIKIENNILAIHPNDFEKDKKKLLSVLADSDINLERFQVLNASLEDVFVKLIGGHDEK